MDRRWGSAMPKYLVTYHDGGEMPDGRRGERADDERVRGLGDGRGVGARRSGAPLSHAKTVSATGVKDGQDRAKIGGYTLLEAMTRTTPSAWSKAIRSWHEVGTCR